MFQERMTRVASTLSDEELTLAIRSAERCAACMTRSRKDLALLRLRCLRCEMERRGAIRPEHRRNVANS